MTSNVTVDKPVQFAQVLAEHAQHGNLREVTVGQFMTPRPMMIRTDANAWELIQIVHRRRVRHLLVANEEGQLVGVISDRDLIRSFGMDNEPDQQRLEAIRAEQLMSSDLITVGPATPLGEAVRLMIDNGINCLPVIAESRAVGILTSTDFYVVLEKLLELDLAAVPS